MIGASLPLFLVSIVMFYVWRLWLRLHGEKWKPTGRQRDSYTAAAQEYLDSMPPLTRREKVGRLMNFLVSLTIVASGAALIFVLAKARH